MLEKKGLSKFAIGEYLSDPEEFNQNVLKEFTKSFDFVNEPIDNALRRYLKSFRLPGEA